MLGSQYKQLIKSIEKDIIYFKNQIYDLRKKICYAEDEIESLRKGQKQEEARDLFTNCGKDKE